MLFGLETWSAAHEALVPRCSCRVAEDVADLVWVASVLWPGTQSGFFFFFANISRSRLSVQKFPWGNGDHSLFHNSHLNALPSGYEESHHH